MRIVVHRCFELLSHGSDKWIADFLILIKPIT